MKIFVYSALAFLATACTATTLRGGIDIGIDEEGKPNSCAKRGEDCSQLFCCDGTSCPRCFAPPCTCGGATETVNAIRGAINVRDDEERKPKDGAGVQACASKGEVCDSGLSCCDGSQCPTCFVGPCTCASDDETLVIA